MKRNGTDFAPAAEHFFTLIELLVVIAVIGILATMLFPVVSSLRARSRTPVCIGNMRQLAIAHLTYAESFDGVFCLAWESSGRQWDVGVNCKGAGLLAAGLPVADASSDEVFQCPETKHSLTVKEGWCPKYAGYGYNYLLSFENINDAPPDYSPVTTAQLRNASGTLIAADAVCFLDSKTLGPTSFLCNPSSGTGGYADFRHCGKAVAVYADGHAEATANICKAGGVPEKFQKRVGYLSEDDALYDPFYTKK